MADGERQKARPDTVTCLVVENINDWLKEKGVTLLKDGGFNHYRAAQTILPMLTVDFMTPEELAHFEKLLSQVGEVL